MSQIRVHHNHNRNRVRIGGEEEKAWRGFYRDAGNPDVAEEIIKELNADEEMKRAHLALYMSCKQTLRINKSRQARNRRIGQFVRWLAGKLCVAPWRFIFGWMRRGRDVAVECLPEVRKEPAEHKVEHLGKEGEFAQAKATFDATEAKVESSTKSTNESNSTTSTNGADSTNGDKKVKGAKNATPAPASVNQAGS